MNSCRRGGHAAGRTQRIGEDLGGVLPDHHAGQTWLTAVSVGRSRRRRRGGGSRRALADRGRRRRARRRAGPFGLSRRRSRCPSWRTAVTASNPPRGTVRSTVPALPVSEGIHHRTLSGAGATLPPPRPEGSAQPTPARERRALDLANTRPNLPAGHTLASFVSGGGLIASSSALWTARGTGAAGS
jgi:hypothetical protein